MWSFLTLKGVDVRVFGLWILWRGSLRLGLLGGVLGFLMLSSILSQLLTTSLVPSINIRVGLQGEQVLGKLFWKRLAGLRVPQPPVAHGILQEGDVLFGSEENLEGFPAGEAAGGEGGDAGRSEVVVGLRLERVLAAGDLPHPGDGLVVHGDKEPYAGLARASHGQGEDGARS